MNARQPNSSSIDTSSTLPIVGTMLYETSMSQLNFDEAEKTLDRLLALYPERQDLDNQLTLLKSPSRPLNLLRIRMHIRRAILPP